mgnify:CR=1 FL=1
MKFAHQSATIRQHGKGMIILETALETAGLTYVFPDGNGIKNIAFQVKRGEIYALYGGHHAGKSVLLQTIIGTLRPQAGTLKLFGNIDYQKERRRIGFVPQKPVTIGSLSPADMLRYFSSVFGTTEIHILDILHLNLKEKKAALLEALEQAKRPVIMLGHGVDSSFGQQKLIRFAQKRQIPIITSVLAKSVLGYDHPLNFGCIGGAYGHRYANMIANAKSDLLLCFGISLCTRQIGTKVHEFARGAKIIRIDIDPYNLQRDIHENGK